MRPVLLLGSILIGGNLCYGSLIQTTQIDISGAGFGSIPRLLTVQQTGTESGCTAVSSSGAIVIGTSACDGNPNTAGNNDAVILGNTVTNTGGSEPPPLADNQKYSTPMFVDYAITSLNQVQIVFDSTNQSNAPTTITDLTLKFYNGTTNAFITSIDGQSFNIDTATGNGGAGVIFMIDAAQQQLVLNALTGAGVTVGNTRIALEATVTGGVAGPESFFLRNSGGGGGVGGPVPEPATYLTLSAALLVLAKLRRRSAVR